jgi:hypothetical protein
MTLSLSLTRSRKFVLGHSTDAIVMCNYIAASRFLCESDAYFFTRVSLDKFVTES